MNFSVLSTVTVVTHDPSKQPKSKERCKYYPSCVNTNCAFYHPTLPCKMFPACKYGDTCAYIHPRCKFDLSCTRTDCNFSHTQITGAVNPTICKLDEYLMNFLTDFYIFFSIINCCTSTIQTSNTFRRLNDL
jgi:hypothetical protein